MFNVLIADDERKIRETISDYLTAKGMNTVTAEDGGDALDKFYGGCFDLVILDVMMPVCSGFEVCSEIRRSSRGPADFRFSMCVKKNCRKPCGKHFIIRTVPPVWDLQQQSRFLNCTILNTDILIKITELNSILRQAQSDIVYKFLNNIIF